MDAALTGVKTIISMVLWCLFMMLLGLVLRINWELFMMGWRAIG